MQPDQVKLPNTDALANLACPVCYGDLQSNVTHLVCAACCRAYPIVDGIPALIPDRAELNRSGD